MLKCEYCGTPRHKGEIKCPACGAYYPDTDHLDEEKEKNPVVIYDETGERVVLPIRTRTIRPLSIIRGSKNSRTRYCFSR